MQGEKWREQRRFALHLLRDFGLGRALMEHKIRDEVRGLVEHLKRKGGAEAGGSRMDVCKPVGVCIANIIDNILFGRTYAHVSKGLGAKGHPHLSDDKRSCQNYQNSWDNREWTE